MSRAPATPFLRLSRLGCAVLASVGGLVVLGSRISPALGAEDFPAFSAPVVDQADVVPDADERRVSAALEDYRRRSGNQVAVAVVKTTDKRSIEDYSIDLARRWGVGSKDKDNGVLLVIAYEDRKLRIEVGRGLEGSLTDLESGRIIRERLIPLLRRNDVAGAVSQGTDAIRQDLGDTQVGALPPVPSDGGSSSEGDSPLWLVLPLGLGLMGAGLFASRGRGRHRGHAGGPILWGGGWGGFGGGSFGGGGGGFGGGGGGSFGGGGASGGW